MPLSPEEIRKRSRECTKRYYQKDENKKKHNEYMIEYQRKNRELLKEYKQQLKAKSDS